MSETVPSTTIQSETLRVDDICKAHGSHWVLKNISFSAEIGEIIHLKGTNGAGKSTLLRILSGESVPSKGSVYLNGKELIPEEHELRNDIYLVPENLTPSPWMTVREYIQFSLHMRNNNLSGNFDSSILETLINDWNLSPFIGRPAGTLSQGENRRLLLSIAFASNTRILMLDEPTIALDESFRNILKRKLEAAQRDKLIIISSHLEREGLPIFDRVIELESGSLISDRALK
jgi:ABC-type multidrug transport system ATPase subunit